MRFLSKTKGWKISIALYGAVYIEGLGKDSTKIFQLAPISTYLLH